MTVEELIKELSKYDGKTEVFTITDTTDRFALDAMQYIDYGNVYEAAGYYFGIKPATKHTTQKGIILG